MRYKKLYQDVLTERNQFKQQCTQAIRQWDQALREKNDYKEALAKVQRQHEEAVKEVNQAMTVRIKASKDLKRLTEERNAAMQVRNNSSADKVFCLRFFRFLHFFSAVASKAAKMRKNFFLLLSCYIRRFFVLLLSLAGTNEARNTLPFISSCSTAGQLFPTYRNIHLL